MTKRGKLEIRRDILNIIRDNKNSIKPTPLLRKSKLSSNVFQGYYSELIEKSLIQEVTSKNQETYVNLTEKGFRFLERYKAIVDFIEEFEL